jgi:3-hydroxyacyl-[acyl-carrier-protein] dehydratase
MQLSQDEIKLLIPHREPMLLVEKVLELIPGISIVAKYTVTGQEVFLQGHFPRNPIVPGFMLAEGVAQTGAILAIKSLEEEVQQGKITLLTSTGPAKFSKKVIPGDTLIYKAEITKFNRKFAVFSGSVFVGESLACSVQDITGFFQSNA